MKICKVLFISGILLSPFLASAHSEVASVQCDHVSGLQILNDFTPDGKPYVSKTLTDLYTTKSDDGFMTHIAVSESKFKEGNVHIHIDVLNNKNEVIKKYILKSWHLDKTFPEKKINRANISNLLSKKVTEPYDTYANLEEKQRMRINLSKVPFDARITILVEDKNPFCSFIFKYGSISEY